MKQESPDRVNELIASNIERRDRDIVERYFSNSDQDVFAILPKLPQTVAGALFSRYSRSELGVRELYIKEFHDKGKYEGAEETAEDFYKRVLDGFGDDSISELGGAHLAMENVSILATKFIEDARIGGSPLEKSTRYVDFSQKLPDGSFKFYKEPSIYRSKVAEIYNSTCTKLFETYVDLLPRVLAGLRITYHSMLNSPNSTKEMKEAWERTIKAKAFDLIRGLLPASTLTNVGLYGNGRFFENLVMKMNSLGYTELADLSLKMKTELDKVIPAFIRKSDRSNDKNWEYQRFRTEITELLNTFVSEMAIPSETVFVPLSLVDWSDSAEENVLAALMYDSTDLRTGEIGAVVYELGPEKMAEYFKRLGDTRTNRRHKIGRGAEYANYEFEIMADYGVYRDLHRHRMMTQQRQLLGTDYGYATVPEFDTWDYVQTEYNKAMMMAYQAHHDIAAEVGGERAQYVVPLAYNIRWNIRVSLRELIWMIELRTQPAGHENYRRICQNMYRAIIDKHPAFAGLFKFVDLENYSLGRAQSEQRQAAKEV